MANFPVVDTTRKARTTSPLSRGTRPIYSLQREIMAPDWNLRPI